jgi:glycosyltransferase involved in cell wall biosynthesis
LDGRTKPMTAGSGTSVTRVMVIGAGWHFTSGISHYTYRLSTALAEQYQVSALLVRRLVPKRLYPGAGRVGADLNDAVYPESVPVYDGVDWYWGQSMAGALRFIDQQHPEVVILQWWTGAVLHSYVRLARYAARRGARIILEWHESQDVGEALLPGTRQYVRALMPRLLSRVSGHIVHSNFDLRALTSAYSIADIPVRVIPHGAYDHLARVSQSRRQSPDSPFRLLYFGVIRPFKGVEDLVEAFSSLTRDQAEIFRLTIVGETWEGWTAPDTAIARSPHADLIDRVDRYVTDAEVAAYYDEADAVVLPYHRSSASGPLAIAMSAGLPVVVTAVGGLVEAVQDYPGALQVPPDDQAALRDALLRLPERRGVRYEDPHSWKHTSQSYYALIHEVQGNTVADSGAMAEPILD